MKTVLKLLSLLSLSALAAAPLLRADEPPAPPAGEHAKPDRAAKRAHRLQHLDETLHLTDAQKTQITAIWSASEQKAKALRGDDSLSKEDRKAQMKEIMKSTRDQVRTVLTPDQQTAFDAMPPPQRKGGHHGPHKGAEADAPPAPKQ